MKILLIILKKKKYNKNKLKFLKKLKNNEHDIPMGDNNNGEIFLNNSKQIIYMTKSLKTYNEKIKETKSISNLDLNKKYIQFLIIEDNYYNKYKIKYNNFARAFVLYYNKNSESILQLSDNNENNIIRLNLENNYFLLKKNKNSMFMMVI